MILRLACLAVLASTLSCTGTNRNPCGLSTSLPDVPSGTLRVTRDGNPYVVDSGLRGYRLINDRTDIEAGELTLAIGKDDQGRNVRELVDQGTFPICILLNDQSDGTTYAQVRATGVSFGTDSSHTGTVALLAKEGDVLVGRFELEAVENGGSGTTTLEDGVFRLGPR